MPMRYAHQPDVLVALKVKESDAERIAALERLETELAAAFDEKTGRTFGKDDAPQTRTIRGLHCATLVLHAGVRSVTEIRRGGRWDGTTYDASESVPVADWQLVFTDEHGVSYGIEWLRGDWSGPIHVTAVWGDQGAEAVPEDVRGAMTTLVIKEYRRRTSSPAEQVGPDGFTVVTPSGWNDPTVQAAIEAHTLVRVIV